MSEALEETTTSEAGPNPDKSSLTVGLTPFGFIGINVVDADGNGSGYAIKTPDEAWTFAGHITALANMMIQGMYNAAMQEKKVMADILQQPEIWKP